MIDVNKIKKEEVTSLKELIHAAAEKSTLLSNQRSFTMFTTNYVEKLEIFIVSVRVLINVTNTASDELKSVNKSLKDSLVKVKPLYEQAVKLLQELSYNIKTDEEDLIEAARSLSLQPDIDNVIDFMSVMIESVNILNISKFKGIVIEGKSKEVYESMLLKEEKEKKRRGKSKEDEDEEDDNDSEYAEPD